MLEKKGFEKDRFSGPKGSTGRGYGQSAQPVGELVNQLSLSGRGPVEGCPKSSISPSSLLFPIEVILFSVRSGRGPVEATVTCQALNVPTTSEPVDP